MKEFIERRDYTSTQIQFFLSFILVFLIGLVAGVALTYQSESGNSENILVQMSIDYGDDIIQSFPSDIISHNTNLKTYLRLVEERHGVLIDMRSVDEIWFVEAMHGIHASENREWIFLVNEIIIGSDPSLYILKDGDIITWNQMTR